jgi:hypothetical protein
MEEFCEYDLEGYGYALFFQLDSLFKIGKLNSDDENMAYDVSNIGEFLLSKLKENLLKMISLIEAKCEEINIYCEKDDLTKRPVKIELNVTVDHSIER